MINVRLIEAEEIQDAIRLADSVFRDPQQISMGTAFPDLFSDALRQSYGAFEDGKLVSFIGLAPSVIHVGASMLKAYSIGSVCTDTEYRGRGIATQVLDKAIEHVEQSGASIMLVSGDLAIYRKKHCHYFGSVAQFEIAKDESYQTNEYMIRAQTATDWHSIRELAGKRQARFEQSITDLARLIRSEALGSCMKLNHRVMIAEKEGRIAAFAVIGVSYPEVQPNQMIAIEWGGDPEGVAALLSAFVSSASTPTQKLTVNVPWHETKLIELLSSGQNSIQSPHQIKTNQGTILIANPPALLEQLHPYLSARNPVSTKKLRIEQLANRCVRLLFENSRLDLSSEQFVELLFNPAPSDFLNSEQSAFLEQLFPIPFPFTGGLNYI